jgi:hypothetical protein
MLPKGIQQFLLRFFGWRDITVFPHQTDDRSHLLDEPAAVFAGQQMHAHVHPRPKAEIAVDVVVGSFGDFATGKQLRFPSSAVSWIGGLVAGHWDGV